jgi:hypothetical protein
MMKDAVVVLTWPSDLQSVDANMAPSSAKPASSELTDHGSMIEACEWFVGIEG